MRGPGCSTFSDEVAAAEAIRDLVDALSAAGIEIKLGQIPDDQRPKLKNLTPSQLQAMRSHKTDIIRVLLAQAMVAEARQIRHQCWYVWPRTDNAAAMPRRYADLLFSARAILPPGYAWEDVTYEDYAGPVAWDHRLNYDGQGRVIPEAGYDADEAEQLLEECKGDARGDQARAS